MGDVFPELKQHEVHIKDVIMEEEESFGRTLIKVRISYLWTLELEWQLSFVYKKLEDLCFVHRVSDISFFHCTVKTK